MGELVLLPTKVPAGPREVLGRNTSRVPTHPFGTPAWLPQHSAQKDPAAAATIPKPFRVQHGRPGSMCSCVHVCVRACM